MPSRGRECLNVHWRRSCIETSRFNGATLEATSACGVSSSPSSSDFYDNLRVLHRISRIATSLTQDGNLVRWACTDHFIRFWARNIKPSTDRRVVALDGPRNCCSCHVLMMHERLRPCWPLQTTAGMAAELAFACVNSPIEVTGVSSPTESCSRRRTPSARAFLHRPCRIRASPTTNGCNRIRVTVPRRLSPTRS